MKTKHGRLAGVAAAGGVLLLAGCGKQTRGNADVEANRAATPAEGGATSTTGDAGAAKNFGDSKARKAADEASPSRETTSDGSTNTPAATEKKDVTIERPVPPPSDR